jgi:hypothetical protein
MNKSLCVITMAIGIASLPVVADTVTPVAPAQWNVWTAPTGIRAAGFWDGISHDGTLCNAGYWLTGTSGGNTGCANVAGSGLFSTTPGALSFLSAAGNPLTPIPFTLNTVGGGTLISLQLKVAGNNHSNVFGWYHLSTPGVRNPLFNGSHGPGASASLSPTGPFAFYLTNGDGVTFTSQSGVNFMLFSQNPVLPTTGSNLVSYWVGVEDMPLPPPPFTSPQLSPTADGDYNDVLVNVTIPLFKTNTVTNGCTLTQGGYQNRFNWKVTASAGVGLGQKTYTAVEINQILATPVRGNGLISLAHQLITAKLNIYFGAPPPLAVVNAVAAADALIGSQVVPPLGIGYLAPSQTTSLTATLDAFNNGRLGPQHCN